MDKMACCSFKRQEISSQDPFHIFHNGLQHFPSCTYTHKIKMKSKREFDTCEKFFSATALVIDNLVVKRHASKFSHTAVKSQRWDLPQNLPSNILLPLLFSLLPEPCICQHNPCNWKGSLPARQNEIRISL